jgi:hypothetical protein
MDIDLMSLIDKALLYYDMKTIKYNKYIESSDVAIDREQVTFKFLEINQDVFTYDILGVFDNVNNIWMWAWMVPEFYMNETIFVKKLLNYGLKLEPTMTETLSPEKLYLKTQLVNSRFLLNDKIQLELHLAIACYLAKDIIKFIYPRIKYLSKDKKKFITIYYIIK